jgi:hypothetical protein
MGKPNKPVRSGNNISSERLFKTIRPKIPDIIKTKNE